MDGLTLRIAPSQVPPYTASATYTLIFRNRGTEFHRELWSAGASLSLPRSRAPPSTCSSTLSASAFPTCRPTAPSASEVTPCPESDSKQAQPESSVDDRALERLRIDLGRAFDWHFNRLLSELGH